MANLEEYLYFYIHDSITQNNDHMEINKMSIHKWMVGKCEISEVFTHICIYVIHFYKEKNPAIYESGDIIVSKIRPSQDHYCMFPCLWSI